MKISDLPIPERSQLSGVSPVACAFAVREKEGVNDVDFFEVGTDHLTILRKLDIEELRTLQKSIEFVIKGDECQNEVQAAEFYRKAFERNPFDDIALMSYGSLIAGQGNLVEGIRWVKKAIEVNPTNARAIANLRAMEQDLRSTPPHPRSCGEVVAEGLKKPFPISLDEVESLDENLDRDTKIERVRKNLQLIRGISEAISGSTSIECGAAEKKLKGILYSLLPWPCLLFTRTLHINDPFELVDFLEHPIYWVRAGAANKLVWDIEKFTPGADETSLLVRAISGLAEHPNSDTRWLALDILLRIQPDKIEKAGERSQTEKWLIQAAKEGDPEVRWAAGRGLQIYEVDNRDEILAQIVEKETPSRFSISELFPTPAPPLDRWKDSCGVCGRFSPSHSYYLFSCYSVNACSDFQLFSGSRSPLITPSAIPVPPRNPNDPKEWITVQEYAKEEFIQCARSNLERDPSWEPPWKVCRPCAKELGFSKEDLFVALEENQKHCTARNGKAVLTSEGEILKKEAEKKCFICTVAFGSDDLPEVQAYRDFRDNFLRRSRLGLIFIRLYYRWGPAAATFVGRRPFLRSRVRMVLESLLPYFSNLAMRVKLTDKGGGER